MRDLRLHALAVLCALPSLGGGAVRAEQPAKLRLVYTQSVVDQRCPGEDALRTAVLFRLGYDPFDAQAENGIDAALGRDGRELFALVARVDARGIRSGERRISSRAGDCAELASAMALAIAIATDPLCLTRPATPAPTALPPPPPPAPAPPPPAPTPAPPPSREPTVAPPPPVESRGPESYRFGLGLVGSLGSAPRAAIGATISAAARWSSFSLGLEGRADLPSTSPAAGGEMRTSLAFASLVPCFHRGVFGGCALLSAGVLQGAGLRFSETRQLAFPFVAAGARVLADLPIVAPISLRLHADLLAPLSPTVLLVDDAEVWSSSPLAVSLGICAIVHFP